MCSSSGMLVDILQCGVPSASNAVLCASLSSIIHLPCRLYYSAPLFSVRSEIFRPYLVSKLGCYLSLILSVVYLLHLTLSPLKFRGHLLSLNQPNHKSPMKDCSDVNSPEMSPLVIRFCLVSSLQQNQTRMTTNSSPINFER